MRACSGTHNFVFHPEIEMNKFTMVLKIKEVEATKLSVFFGLGYLQHVWIGWIENQALQYNSYMISERANLKNALSFAYGASLERRAGLPSTDGKKREEDEVNEISRETALERKEGRNCQRGREIVGEAEDNCHTLVVVCSFPPKERK